MSLGNPALSPTILSLSAASSQGRGLGASSPHHPLQPEPVLGGMAGQWGRGSSCHPGVRERGVRAKGASGATVLSTWLKVPVGVPWLTPRIPDSCEATRPPWPQNHLFSSLLGNAKHSPGDPEPPLLETFNFAISPYQPGPWQTRALETHSIVSLL